MESNVIPFPVKAKKHVLLEILKMALEKSDAPVSTQEAVLEKLNIALEGFEIEPFSQGLSIQGIFNEEQMREIQLQVQEVGKAITESQILNLGKLTCAFIPLLIELCEYEAQS